MSFKLLLLVFCYAFLQCQAATKATTDSIKMVYVISGHTYYSSNLIGELSYESLSRETTDIPVKQKNGLFKLGSQLRSIYSTVLGNEYSSKFYTMHTSESPVSMITGLLINAGLWPPMGDQKWSFSLDWQPVPYEYEKMNEDLVLAGTLCPTFEQDVQKSSKISRLKDEDKMFNSVVQKIHSEYPQLQLKTRMDLLKLYYIFRSMEDTLSAEMKKVFTNDTFVSLAWEGFKDLTETPLQKHLNGGTFLKKLLNDFDEKMKPATETMKVMSIYSGDEINVAGILTGLQGQLSNHSEIPLALIFELHHKSKTYNVVIKSLDKALSSEPKVLTVPGCETNCTIESFKMAVAKLIAKDEVQLCGRTNSTNVPGSDHGGKPNFASQSSFSFFLLFATVLVTTFAVFK